MKTVKDNKETNKHDCVPIKLYLWIQKCELHVTCVLQNVFLLLIFFQPLKNVKKAFLATSYVQAGSRVQGGFGLWASFQPLTLCNLLLRTLETAGMQQVLGSEERWRLGNNLCVT
jgi:hypothetical protein